MTKVTLTKRQGEALKIMEEALDKTGAIPTAKMLSQTLGISPKTLYAHIGALIDLGLVLRLCNNNLELNTGGYIIEVKNKATGICKGYRYTGKNKPGRRPYKYSTKEL